MNTYSLTSEVYFLDTPPLSSDTFLILSLFRNIGLISNFSSLFLIIFNGYNYNTNDFVTITLKFEQNSVGNVQVGYDLCILNFLDEIYLIYNFKLSFKVISTIVCMLMLIVYCFYNIVLIFKDIKREKLKYFLKMWNLIKCTQIFLYFAGISLRSLLYLLIIDKIKVSEEPAFYDTSYICYLKSYLSSVDVLMICFTLIYFLQYFDENIIGPIFETMYLSMKNIAIYLISYIFILTGYGLFGHYVYGNVVPSILYNYFFRIQISFR